MRFIPHPVTLRQLQYIVAIADARNFRKAAGLCHVSQPSLSSQVAQVEDALGARLFERDRRGVLITKAGEEFVRRARTLLLAADDMVDSAARFADPLAGTLRIGVIPTIAPYLLPEIAPALRREFPTLRVLWTEERTPEIASRLREGELDAGLLALEADLGDVEHEAIGRDAFVLAMSPQHALASSGRPIRADALEPASLLLLTDGHCLRDQALAACGRTGAPESAFSATSLATLAQVVAGGDKLTLLPELALAVENRHGELHIRRFTKPAPGRTLVLCWRPASPAASGLRRLARVMREAYPGGRGRRG